ncbi:ion channel [Marinicella sp. S1101]|nr:ion channel [Marinicella marina]MDJ1138605.1 ion channel [Marinicella marina]
MTLTALMFIGAFFTLLNAMLAIAWASITILDIIQYQLRLVLLRPVYHENYSPYSAERTLIILILQYLQLIGCFSLLYFFAFNSDFCGGLNVCQSIEFSIVTITTLGYGNIVAQPGSLGALVASLQALIGVFFLGLIISTAIGRAKS